MRLYETTTEFNCGIDLHSRCMYACVVDPKGNVLVHKNIKGNDFEYFLRVVEPYRHDLTVCSECTFNWYWLADACEDVGIEFVLAHALYLRSIHATKKKNDKIDSEKIAHLLRTNMIPYSYVYPRTMRPLRTVVRTRMNYVWLRSEMLGKQTCRLMAEGKQLTKMPQLPRKRWERAVSELHTDPHLQALVTSDCAIIHELDRQIDRLERILKAAMAIQAGTPLPSAAAQAESLRPACTACGTRMEFQRRMSSSERSAMFPSAIHTRGPP